MKVERVSIMAGVMLCGTLSIANAYDVKPDKRKHAETGAIIGASMSMYAEDYKVGAGMACAAGVAKELYDAAMGPPAKSEMADMAFTCAAGMITAYSFQGFRIGVNGDAPVIGISIQW